LYASATKGYKFGGYSSIPIGFDTQVTSVQQESVLAFEAGVKATFANGRMQAGGAIFHYDYRDKQIAGSVPVPPFGTLPGIVNVPRSRINGAEITLAGQPTDQLRFSLSATHIDGKVNESFVTSNPFGILEDIDNSRLPNAPRWQLSADTEYQFQTSGNWRPFIGGGINYQTDTDPVFSGGAEYELPARTLVDLRAGVETEDGTWRIQAFGRNVTNKYYWINVSRTVDAIVRYAGLPATYGISVRHKF
jgi:iron complex outermembrane recepter protein